MAAETAASWFLSTAALFLSSAMKGSFPPGLIFDQTRREGLIFDQTIREGLIDPPGSLLPSYLEFA